MAKQIIAIGSAVNDGTGDPARTCFTKSNGNFTELYNFLGGGVATTALPNALPITSGGHGATTKPAAANNLGLKIGQYNGAFTSTAALGTSDLNALVVSGYYKLNLTASELSNSPPLKHASGLLNGLLHVMADSTMSAVHQIFYNSYYSIDSYYLRFRFNSSQWSQWIEVKHSGNTTIDGNGFIKSASPIVKLFVDRIELNEEAKLQDITFEKLGIGNYLIKNSSGFAQEGWYIETPKDANGNVLFSVIYDTLESGDISIKTYKKKFDLETASIVADLNSPIDITEGRQIDLRLQELPQSEIEVIDELE